MGIVSRVVNALRGREMERPRLGQIIQAEPMDSWRDYPADGLTPGRLVSILKAADEGAVDQAMALYEQMEEKDAHLYCVANTRRLAVTGLRWQVLSASEVREGVDRVAADEAAGYAREVLAEIEDFDAVLQHLSMALGRNAAVAENVWEARGSELRLVDVVPIPFERLAFDALGTARVLTQESPIDGIQLAPNKFVVYAPHAVSGHPMHGGLLRVTALAYLGKHFAMKDWMVFAEVFGMPLRIARYEPSATPEEKRELLRMLEALGSDAAGIFSKAVEVEFLEANRGTVPPPFEAICNFMNREMSKAWLGETLTVETGGQTGVQATAPVHNEVRLDLRQDDIVKEGRVIRRDVLGPITRMRFGAHAPVPYFRRQFDPPRDLKEMADVLNVAVNQLGMQVPVRWAHAALGMPAGAAQDESLKGR